MPTAKSKQTIARRKFMFSLEKIEANEVILMGDFNKWNPKIHPMKNDGNGTWNKVVMLYPGRYEYKFLIDGEWKEDPRSDQVCLNRFGTQNSVLNLTAP